MTPIKKNLFLISLVVVLMCSVSCMDDIKRETTPQAAITSFVVGYYNVERHEIDEQGHDTTVYIREGGVNYPMTIDQMSNTIYNVDSLSYGADVRRVTTLVGGEGTIYYWYSDNPDSVLMWSIRDSIDFTRPLIFCALSTDGTYKRSYTVKLNVRTVFPDSLHWSQSDSIGYCALQEPCAVVLNDTVYNFGKDTTGVLMVVSKSIFGGAWTAPVALSGLSGNDWNRVALSFGNRIYLQSGTTVYGSSDGINWTEVKSGVKCLIRTDNKSKAVWAVCSDSTVVKTTDMANWTSYGKKPTGFPDSISVSMDFALATNTSISKTLLVGLADDSLYASVWTILSTDSIWSEIDAPANTSLRLPTRDQLAVIGYDGRLFAFGAGLDGFRQSNDNGITWYYCDSYAKSYSTWNRYMQFPNALRGYNGDFSYAVDGLGTIWILTSDGQVWRGAIRRLDKRGR